MATAKDSTALAKAPEIVLGRLGNDQAFSDLVGDGFAQVETVIFGDETQDSRKLSRYVGVLVGNGAPIERADAKTGEVRAQKTYAFHPMTKLKDGNIGVAEHVTHVIPASYMMQAGLDRIMEECVKRNKTAIVGMLYRGQIRTRQGFMVNDIGLFEKYI